MRFWWGVVALAVGVTALPANAQRRLETQTGSRIGVPRAARIPDNVRISQTDRARITMAEFARCTLDLNRRNVDSALSTPFDGPWKEAVEQLVSSDCLNGGEMRFKAVILRGALFAELWRRQVLDEARGRPAEQSIPPIDFQATSEMKSDEAKRSLAMLAFADCVVTAKPHAASAIVSAPTASSEQAAAYAEIQPVLGGCLPQGSTMKLSKPILEGVVAEVLVRKTVASSSLASKAE